MRKECYTDEHGVQVEKIIDEPSDRRKCKYNDAKKVGRNKEELKKIIDEYNAKH